MSLRTIITIHTNAILLLALFTLLSLFASGCPKKPVEPEQPTIIRFDTGMFEDLPDGEDLPEAGDKTTQ